jgi:hypothetical protein
VNAVNVDRPLLEFEAAPLPMPTRSCEPFGLLYHPVDACLWMLDFSSGQLWRYTDEGWSLVSNARNLMPAGYSQTYSWSFHFYWDGKRKAPVWFTTGYGGSGLPIMGVWDGKRFAESTPKDSLKSSNRDAFAWDAGRNVLVHFVSVREGEPRFASGTLRARELDAEGVWRNVGPAQKMTDPVNLMAGYDGDLGATVCISADGIAYAWDGARWKTVPVETTYPWFPYATAPALLHPQPRATRRAEGHPCLNHDAPHRASTLRGTTPARERPQPPRRAPSTAHHASLSSPIRSAPRGSRSAPSSSGSSAARRTSARSPAPRSPCSTTSAWAAPA